MICRHPLGQLRYLGLLRQPVGAYARTKQTACAYSSSSAQPVHDRPFRVAIVGSGPAGFYTAQRLLKKIPEAHVDMYERLPVPFGLARFGVAPDHPEVKNCQDTFADVAESPNFSFRGNVAIGLRPKTSHGNASSLHANVPLETLMRHYDAITLSYGASHDRELHVPGEHLDGIYSARQFVGWYNGWPDHEAALDSLDLTRGDTAVIVGQGNVALDVARILLTPVDRLRHTDITEAALEQLAYSRIRRVHIVGRRGPMQAAFSIKEIRELIQLDNVRSHIDPLELPPNLKEYPRAKQRILQLLASSSSSSSTTTTSNTTAISSSSTPAWSLDFCLSPHEFLAHPDAPGQVQRSVFSRTQLQAPFDPESKALATEEKIELPSPLVFRSIGYRTEALPDFHPLGVAFNDHLHTILTDGCSRVLQTGSLAPYPGLYSSGWAKRGPLGVIASTLQDAFLTADVIASDRKLKKPFLEATPSSTQSPTREERRGWEGVVEEMPRLPTHLVVDWNGWKRIDAVERERGKALGKPREKLTSSVDMLECI